MHGKDRRQPKAIWRVIRDTIKRIVMALIEGTHFFKTRKKESKRILAKYSRQNNEAYLESSYNGNAPF